MKEYFIAMLFCLVTEHSNAFNAVIENNTVFHETTGENVVISFVEDTISLLPPEMLTMLIPHFHILLKVSEFTLLSEYIPQLINRENLMT